MDCCKCEHFVFIGRTPYIEKGFHYCEKLVDGSTYQRRKKYCGGMYFEPKEKQ